MKKPNGRLLLTWNKDKHPEIVEFFNNIEEGLYSHSVRKAIKFYMDYNDSINENNPPKSSNKSFSGGFQNNSTESMPATEDVGNSVKNSEYVDFDINEL